MNVVKLDSADLQSMPAKNDFFCFKKKYCVSLLRAWIANPRYRIINTKIMKESLKQFLEYYDSDEELAFYIRINAEWNEESFVNMKKLIKVVIEDHNEEIQYDPTFIYYCVDIIQFIVDLISNNAFYNGTWPKEFTEESYKAFLDERIKELKQIREDFIILL